MSKKNLKLLLLLITAVIALGLFAGCKKKAKKTEAPATTTTTTAESVTETTESTATTEDSSKETAAMTTESTTETEAPTTTEKATEPPTEKAPSTEASTETTTEATKKTKATTEPTTAPSEAKIDEDGTYTSKDDVALYIHTYGHLPKNFVTKSEARAKGWEGGSLEDYFPGCSIGGDKFGNREGALPKKNGRTYTECDIDTKGKKSRGAKRIVFSNDGLIYYTDDHYETFTLLYGEV
ncbi:MAG: ribonuclease domain-containing protein [Saccharofermentanaceae bacterium]|nr:ribonuclease domain-containing protein [Saccharofermentanaceae bacterium]